MNGILLNQQQNIDRTLLLQQLNNLSKVEISNMLGYIPAKENDKASVGLSKVDNLSLSEIQTRILTNPILTGGQLKISPSYTVSNDNSIATTRFVNDIVEKKERVYFINGQEKEAEDIVWPYSWSNGVEFSEFKDYVNGNISYNGLQLIFNDGSFYTFSGNMFAIDTSKLNFDLMGTYQTLQGYIKINTKYDDTVSIGYNIPEDADGTFNADIMFNETESGGITYYSVLLELGQYKSLKPIQVGTSRISKSITDMIQYILNNMVVKQ